MRESTRSRNRYPNIRFASQRRARKGSGVERGRVLGIAAGNGIHSGLEGESRRDSLLEELASRGLLAGAALVDGEQERQGGGS